MWFALFVVASALLLYWKYSEKRHKTNFWEKNGVPWIDISQKASTLQLLLGFKNQLDLDRQISNEMGSHKFFGIIESGKPVLLIKDPELAKRIMIKDFDGFVDRPTLFEVSQSPAVTKWLPSLKGREWRGVRVSVSPTFTTGRMRRLMECFNNCGVEWMSHLKTCCNSNNIVEIKSSAGAYAVDVIASAVFGLKAGSIQNEDSVFLQMSKALADTSFIATVRMGFAMYFPKLFRLLKLEAFDATAIKFFEQILRTSLKARESGEMSARNDFLQLIVEARKGVLKPEREEDLSTYEKEAKLSDAAILEIKAKEYLLNDDIVMAHGFIFFLAGNHGIAMTVTYAVHALAHHPDVQVKLREELEGKFDKEGKIGYDDVNQLIYMEMFISEIFRYYPITSRLARMSTKDYKNEELGLEVSKGTKIDILVAAIHKDPAHYQNPDKFDPEHFSVENKAARHPYSFMPFGHGPRNCIGIRFAQVEVKTAIAHVVHNFIIQPKTSCPFPIKTKLVGHGVQIPEDVHVKLIPRTDFE